MQIRFTNEELDRRLIGTGVKRIGNVIGANKPVLVGCEKEGCGYTWNTLWSNLKARIRDNHTKCFCKRCNGIENWSNDLIDRILTIQSRNIKRIGECNGAHGEIRWACLKDKCDNQWLASPDSIFNAKSGCPECGGSKKTTNSEIDEIIKPMHIKRITDIINVDTDMKFKCLIKDCGHEWECPPTYQIRRYNLAENKKEIKGACPKCENLVNWTNEELDIKLKDKLIKRKSNTLGNDIPILWRCKVVGCGCEWSTTPRRIITYDSGCIRCNGKETPTNKIIDKKLKGRFIVRIGDFIDSKKKLTFKCTNPECKIPNYMWSSLWSNINFGKGCPICKAGKSERELLEHIRKILKPDVLEYQHKIKYNGKPYKIDFYIKIGKIKILIERNGKQHYQPDPFYNMTMIQAEENFVKQVVRDVSIAEYCKSKNIPLYIIPYYWKNDRIIDELTRVKENKYKIKHIKNPRQYIIDDHNTVFQYELGRKRKRTGV
jgi:hypothetical protein